MSFVTGMIVGDMMGSMASDAECQETIKKEIKSGHIEVVRKEVTVSVADGALLAQYHNEMAVAIIFSILFGLIFGFAIGIEIND